MGLYRDENPLLGTSAAIDEGLGIETNNGSKIIGSFVEQFYVSGANASNGVVNQPFFIAPYPVEVVAVNLVFGVNSASGNVMIEKETGTTAIGSGNNLLSATISTAGANNTVTNGTLVSGSSLDLLQLAKGDRLSALFGGNENGL